jgi:hypothetical protein
MNYLLNYNGWKKIYEQQETQIASGNIILANGSRGKEVSDLQLRLINLNYPLSIYGIDGIFGPETKGAVEKFQEQNGLEINGIAGPETLALLNSSEAKPLPMEDADKASASVATIQKDMTDYDTVVATVIDKLEGGYFHPNMRTENPAKFGEYHRSGETMFGLDRHAGHGLYYATPRKATAVLANLSHIESGEYQYKTPEAKEFWETIDAADAKNKWPWNYKGGTLESKLRYLAGRIIKPQFEHLTNLYLSPKAKEIVLADGRLLFHFIYATWNGSGWFQKFAKDINSAIEKGVTSPDQLVKVAIDSRTKEGLQKGSLPNSLIARGGDKIEKIIGMA